MSWGLKWGLPVLAGALLLSAADASASNMRCQNKIVDLGDTAYEVKALCGPPDDIQQRTEERRVVRAVERACLSPTGRCAAMEEVTVNVVVDIWTYDFGPQRFIQYLLFEGGKLRSIRSGDYGHKQ